MIFQIFDQDRKINGVINKLRKHFDFLFDHGFEIIDKSYNGKAFGNWTVLLCSEKHVIQFTQDRGDITLLIGLRLESKDPRNSYLTDLNTIVRYIKDRDFDIRENFPRDEDGQLQRLRTLLLDNEKETFAYLSQSDFEKEEARIRKLVNEKIKKNAY